MAWMVTDYSKHSHFRWKIKWRLEHLGALGTMGETTPLTESSGIKGATIRAELPDVNINTGAQSINPERASSLR